MESPPLRIVLDTNVLLAGITSRSSPSKRVVNALTRRSAVILPSKAVLEEYRTILSSPLVLTRFPELTLNHVTATFHKLRYVGDVVQQCRFRFVFPRDPGDAKFVELAAAGGATHLVTLDPDLLSLPDGRGDASKRFRQRLPRLEVLRRAEFVAQYPWLFTTGMSEGT